jgi:hypothetical protein
MSACPPTIRSVSERVLRSRILEAEPDELGATKTISAAASAVVTMRRRLLRRDR